MTLRIGEIAVDCSDPERAAEFWCAALGYRITDQDPTGVAIAGSSTAPTILLLASSDPKTSKNRLHFDLCPLEGSTRADEVDRLIALGATPVDIGQGDSPWSVLADPCGNEFCVMPTTLPPEPEPFHHLDA
ncbi:MAG: VOC family protein [Ilumatobacteraceae bacterium]